MLYHMTWHTRQYDVVHTSFDRMNNFVCISVNKSEPSCQLEMALSIITVILLLICSQWNSSTYVCYLNFFLYFEHIIFYYVISSFEHHRNLNALWYIFLLCSLNILWIGTCVIVFKFVILHCLLHYWATSREVLKFR